MLRDILLYPFIRFFEAPDLGLGYLNYDSLDSKIVYIPFFLLFIFGTSGYMFCKKNNSPEIGYTFSETKEIVASMFEISTFASQFYNETYFSILVCGMLTISLFSIYRLVNNELTGVDKIITNIFAYSLILWLFLSYILLKTKSSDYSVGYLPSFRFRKQRYTKKVK